MTSWHEAAAIEAAKEPGASDHLKEAAAEAQAQQDVETERAKYRGTARLRDS